MLQLSQLHLKSPVCQAPEIDGLISKGDEPTNKWEIDHLVKPNLEHNALKTDACEFQKESIANTGVIPLLGHHLHL